MPRRQGPWELAVRRLARRVIKGTFWYPMAGLLDRLGYTLQAVQVLVIDPERRQVLLLRSDECRGGWCPVQGLRDPVHRGGLRFAYSDDPRDDAHRELGEEALAKPPPVTHLQTMATCRAGPGGELACTVYVLEVAAADTPLIPATAEGQPTWVAVDHALATLPSPTLRTVLEDYR